MENWKVLKSEAGDISFSVIKDDLAGYADGKIETYVGKHIIVYCDYKEGKHRLCKVQSVDNGDTWDEPELLVEEIFECLPAIGQDAKGVLWVYYIGADEKLYRIYSKDEGLSWESPEEINEIE